jgi:hypothetical protein
MMLGQINVPVKEGTMMLGQINVPVKEGTKIMVIDFGKMLKSS